MRILSELFEIDILKLELLIDVISGNPVRIFKVYPKNVEFDREKNVITGKFD